MIDPAWGRRGPGVAAAALVVAFAAPSEAAAPPTVVLVAPVGDAFEARMRAELESMGFDVLVQGTLGADAPSGVLAVARVVPGPPRRIEVLVVATDTSSRVPSRTAVIEAPVDSDETTVSVRAAEQLRAFFQPLRPPPVAAPPDEPPAPRSPRAPAESPSAPAESPSAPAESPADAARIATPPSRDDATGLTVSAALGAAFDVGGVGLDTLAGARLHLGEHVALGLVVVAPLTATSVQAAEGEATLRSIVTGVDLAAVLDVGALRVMPSAGVALAVVVTEGEAAPPYEGQTDPASAALPFVRLEVAPRLVGPVRVSVQGLGGVAVPPVGVRFAGREVATWGQPFAGVFLGATLAL